MGHQIPPARIHFSQEDRAAILERIDEALNRGALTLGENGKTFEREFAAYIGTRHAIAVNSGTSALEIALRIFGIDGKEVLVPTNTFFATPAAVLHAGGRVRFVDADPETFSVKLQSIKERVTPETAAVIVVHIAGIVTPELPNIQVFCKERGLFLLEDAAHAHGSALNGKMAGTFGDVAAFSFYPTKVMTSGEGGMIVTDKDEIFEEALVYRDQGKSSFETNFHTRLGNNWRMSELHAILGSSQLRRLETFIDGRAHIAAIYDKGLRDVESISPIQPTEGNRCNYYKYIALLDDGIDRNVLKQNLRDLHHVALSGEVYDVPCHMQPVFKAFSDGSFPNAESVCGRHICLPIYPTMTAEEAEYVVSSVATQLRSL